MPRFATLTDLHHYVSDHVGPLADHEPYRDEIVAEVSRRIRSTALECDLEWGDDWDEALAEAFGPDNWIQVLGEVCEEIASDYVQQIDISLSREDVQNLSQGRVCDEIVILALQMFSAERHPNAEISVRISPHLVESWACVDGCERTGAKLIQAFIDAQRPTNDAVMPEDDE